MAKMTTEQRVERIETLVEEIHLALGRQIGEAKRDAAQRREQAEEQDRSDRRRAAEKPQREKLMREFIAERCSVGSQHRASRDGFAMIWKEWMLARSDDLNERIQLSTDTVRDEFFELSKATECEVYVDRFGTLERRSGLAGVSIKPQFRHLGDIASPGDDATAQGIWERRGGAKITAHP